MLALVKPTTKRALVALTALPVLALPAAVAVSADAKSTLPKPFAFGHGKAEKSSSHKHTPSYKKATSAQFSRVATYPVYLNVPTAQQGEQTVSEISAVSKDGKTLIYTDALGQRIGFVDISKPSSPRGLGTLDVTELAGLEHASPTSVAVVGGYVLVVVDQTPPLADAENDTFDSQGALYVVELKSKRLVRAFDLGGQPDSIDVSADGKYAAIAMENQRNEDHEASDGGLPQAPAGFVSIIDLKGKAPASWKLRAVELPAAALRGLDTPEDAEPEYVTINSRNKLAVTLQENNGIVIIDLAKGKIEKVFSAGAVKKLEGVDARNDGYFQPTDTLTDLVREPDAIGWIDDRYLATANEGDWKGGSRGWSIFDSKTGKVVWDAGASVEDIAFKYGLHNEDRAAKKGVEPEGLAIGKFGKTTYAFVGSERSNFVAVYDVSKPTKPTLTQVLATGVGPEGILPIPGRDLLVVSSEEDEPGDGVRAGVSVFEFGKKANSFPNIVSAEVNGKPIGWTALGALSAKPGDKERIYAAADLAMNPGSIFEIDITRSPAVITSAIPVLEDGQPVAGLDIEGIFARPQGGFWVGVEGATGAQNKVLRLDATGQVVETVALPADIAAVTGSNGIEGVTAITDTGGEHVFVAMQRSAPAQGTPTLTRIGRYDVADQTWSWYGYTLEERSTAVPWFTDWIGLSEIVAVDANTLAVIERDKLSGPNAKVKRIYTVTLPGTVGGTATAPVMLDKSLAYDVLPDLQATRGWTQEKLEGLTIGANGRVYAVTDNDGLDAATGETVFLDLGPADEVFYDAQFD